jgi:hypothetical protein
VVDPILAVENNALVTRVWASTKVVISIVSNSGDTSVFKLVLRLEATEAYLPSDGKEAISRARVLTKTVLLPKNYAKRGETPFSKMCDKPSKPRQPGKAFQAFRGGNRKQQGRETAWADVARPAGVQDSCAAFYVETTRMLQAGACETIKTSSLPDPDV